jgi:hypothetical protein
MNPLASTKSAGRLLMALPAIASILLLAACSTGSSSPAPNGEGFNNSNLKGTYVFSISGTDFHPNTNTGSFFAFVGTIKADGNGNITGGTVDINDANLGGTGVFLAQPVLKTAYSVSSDGRGTAHLPTAEGNFGLDFVLTSSTHGMITRFDQFGSGSGTLDLQGSASQSSLGSLAFSLAGSDSTGNPLGTVGAFALNSSTGAITSGTQDFNDNGVSTVSGSTGLQLTGGSLVLASSGTSGTAVLTTSSIFGSLAFDVWVIDSTHLKLIETDSNTSGYALSGDAFTQQTSFTRGPLVYTLAGVDSGLVNPVAAGGYATTDANGGLSNLLEDYNDDGTTNTLQNLSGSCLTFVAGRCQLNLPTFSNGTAADFQFAAYPSSGGVQLLEIDGHGLMQGTAYAQTATSFAASTGYGLNLSGVNVSSCFSDAWAEVDDIAQFQAGTPDTSSTGPVNMNGLVDENDLACELNFNSDLGGVYIPDPSPDGRGSISVSTPSTLITGLTLEYYVVDGSTMLFVEGDQQQVAIGTFQAQSSTASAATAQSHMAIVHPAFRAQAALRSR